MASDWVDKLYPLGMEIEARGGHIAIKAIAKDWGIQPLGMGTSYPKLVGTASVGIEGNESTIILGCDYLVVGNRWLTPFMVNHLAWAVIEVGS